MPDIGAGNLFGPLWRGESSLSNEEYQRRVADLERKAALLDEAIQALRESLPLLEMAEDQKLIGDEGCLWEVEVVRGILKKAEALKGV